MDFETQLKENYTSKPMNSTENNNIFKPIMGKEELQFGVLSKGCLQEFQHIDQFQGNGSSSPNPVFGVQASNFDSLNNFTYGCSSTEFEFYESKPFSETNNKNNDTNVGGHVMDNFQYNYSNGFTNVPHRIPVDLNVMGSNHICTAYNSSEIKTMSFGVPDEVSYISPGNGYYKRHGMNKNRTSPMAKRTNKVRKKPNIVKGQWTSEEDRILIQLVEQHGIRKWSHIAQMLPGRIGKQCRERWHNHLRPDIKKETWSEEEDKVLIQAHAEIGNKWAEIAKRLPGRTENSIKNHWNATKRRQYSKRKCRSKYPRGSLLQEYIKSLNLDVNPQIDYRKKSASMTRASNINITSKEGSNQPESSDDLFFNPSNDRLVPNYDFNEVPEFCFDENLFQDGCNIDSLLDDMPCAPNPSIVEDKEREEKNPRSSESSLQEVAPKMSVCHVKKELDLVEMMSQVNEVVNV